MVRRVNARVESRGVKLRDENEGGKDIKQILCAGDTVLLVESKENFQLIVNEFIRACNRMLEN